VDRPWTWLRQVHADRVVVVDAPGAGAGEDADAAVTRTTGAVLAVHTADCAPIALVAEGGAVAVAHAGWRGLADGIVAATVAELGALAAGPVQAVVGPLIGPECYEFGVEDLQLVVDRLGPEVAGTTSVGTPALDLPTGVRRALEAAGVDDVAFVGGCTACGGDAFSHRARGDQGRQAVLAWIEEAS
jgi:polyphenol oxidase